MKDTSAQGIAIDRRGFVKATGAAMAVSVLIGGAGMPMADRIASAEEASGKRVAGEVSPIDMSAWNYDADADVYWQVGLAYCALPADQTYETMGIFVPGAYFSASENGDGTYTCAIDEAGEKGGYTAATAPMVIPVNTPGYSAMAAPTGFSSEATTYTEAGFVYLQAGCRGRDHGAPAGVTDLKAALRYVRANADSLPGSTDRIFSFGMSGGGAQSALMGATGNSDLYLPYLKAIGAVETTGDEVAGSMCWCPITNLDTADAAYEWNMGITRTGLDEESQRISDALAASYANYINGLGLVDAGGIQLALEASDEGVCQAGTYYEHIRAVIEESLNNFLADTVFPYTPSSSGGMGGFGGPGGAGGRGGFGGPNGGGKPGFADGEGPGGDFGGFGDGEMPDFADGNFGGFDGPDSTGTDGADLLGNVLNGADTGGTTVGSGDGAIDGGTLQGNRLPEVDDAVTAQDEQAAQYAADGISRTETATASRSTETATYETPADYVASLNADEEWVAYDEATGTATVTSVMGFVRACKNASKSLGAFDQLDCGQGENTLFGNGDGVGAHFDATLAGIMVGTEYETAFAEDLSRTDALGNTVDVRLAMYTPLYYLCDAYAGAGTADVAPHWRIRTGINQGDTALSTEVNLALALEAYGCDVDFATVWGQGHTQAERTGSSTQNFIDWVNEVLA